MPAENNNQNNHNPVEVPPDEENLDNQNQNDGAPSNEGEKEEPPSLMDEVNKALEEESGSVQPKQEKQDQDSPEDDGEDEPGAAKKEGKESQGTKDDQPPSAESQEKAGKKADQDQEFVMPDGLDEKGRESFNHLLDEVKTSREERNQYRQGLSEIYQVIQDTGADKEQLATTFDYLKMRTSNERADVEKAYELAKEEVRSLGMALGKEEFQDDILKDYPDLQREVEDETLTAARALEIAEARNSKKAAERPPAREEAQAQPDNQTQEYQTAHQKAVEDIKLLQAGWAETDVDFEAKQEILMKNIKSIFVGHPSNWVPNLKTAYNNLGYGADLARQKLKRRIKPDLRSTEKGGGNKQPANALEAVTQAFEDM